MLDVAFELSLAAQQPMEKIVRVVVRVLFDVVDSRRGSVSSTRGTPQAPPRSLRRRHRDPRRTLLCAGELEVDLVGGTEQRPAFIQVDVFDGHVVTAGGERRTRPPGRQRLPRSRWAVDRDGRREIALVGPVEQGRQLAFLTLASHDLVGGRKAG